MIARPLLLGLRHRDDTNMSAALSPASGSGRNLHQLSGLPLDQYNQAFDRANAADLPDLTNRRVVVLGREAWKRLGLSQVAWFTTVRNLDAVLTLIPHPSGRCRIYNDPAARQRARGLLQSLCRECKSR